MSLAHTVGRHVANAVTFVLASTALLAQGAPALVADINPTPVSSQDSFPLGFASGGSVVVFAAFDQLSGTELWSSDGAKCYRVADIWPGPASSLPSWLVPLGNTGSFLFTADDGAWGRELWSVHPPAAPVLVRDIAIGAASSNPNALTYAGGVVFFFAANANGRQALWKSDGTSAGTVKVSDISLVAASASFSTSMTAIGNRVFFEANDTVSGWEPYVSDGTSFGTQQYIELVPGNNPYNPVGVRVGLQGALLFTYEPDATHSDLQLWRTDGSTAGTGSYWSYQNGPFPISSQQFVALSTTALLLAGPFSDVWRTDGTAAGTQYSRHSAQLNSAPPVLRVAGNRAFLFEGPLPLISPGPQLQTYDETSSIWTPIFQLGSPIGVPTPSFNGVVHDGSHWLFSLWTPAEGRELWRSDGTPGGTALVKDINPGPGSSQAMGAFAIADAAVGPANRVFFVADDGVDGFEPWVSDGTALGTHVLADISHSGSNPRFGTSVLGGTPRILAADNGAVGSEPWSTAGSGASTSMVTDLIAGSLGSDPDDIVVLDNGLTVFTAVDPTLERQLFCTDGTPAGTLRLTSNSSGTVGAGASISGITRSGPYVYFSMPTADGAEPWRTDGTLAGTFQLRDIMPGAAGSNPIGFADVLGSVYFAARSPGTAGGGGQGRLWRSDGSPAGTVEIAPITVTPRSITWMDGNLYFSGTGAEGRELWRYAGTGAPAVFVDVNPGVAGSSPQDLVASGNRLFFVADDGSTGRELWVSDGTSPGTTRVADLTPGAGGSTLLYLQAFRTGLLFAFDDGVNGLEPWFTDGTAAGTRMLLDVNPGVAGSIAPAGGFIWSLSGSGRALFAADDGVHGNELWRTDGTPAGTVLHADINPSGGSSPEIPSLVSNAILFAADDGSTGREPWAVSSMAVGIQFGHGCGPDPLRLPRLSSPDVPTLGNSSYRIQLDFAASNAPLFLGFDLEASTNPIGSGCELYLPRGTYVALASDAVGKLTLPLGLPNDPIFRSIAVYFQALVIDPSGPYLNSWSTSNGFKIVLSDN